MADTPQVNVNGAIARLQVKLGEVHWTAAQWEQAYYDLRDKDLAAIASLTNQIESLNQQLAAARAEVEQ